MGNIVALLAAGCGLAIAGWSIAGMKLGVSHLVVGVVDAGLVAAFTILILNVYSRMRRRVRQRFCGRQEMTIDAFCDAFYGGGGVQRAAVEEVLETVAAALRIPMGVLRPSDRFDVELRPEPGWEYDSDLADVVHYVAEVRDRAQRAGLTLPQDYWPTTVGELIGVVTHL